MIHFSLPQWIWILEIALSVINVILALVIIFIERKNPAKTLAWILVLFFLPIVGAVVYLVFAQNISRRKIYKLDDKDRKIIRDSLEDQIEEMNSGKLEFSNDVANVWRQMIKLNLVYGEAYLTQNNSIDMFSDGKDFFRSLMKDIKAAKYSIDIEFYIIKPDFIGQRLLKLLTDKAKEGVQVRLLIDALGSRRISDRKLKDFIDAGGKVEYFFKPKFKYLNFDLNYRNHRKVVVIDNKYGYIGGFNIAKEYLGFKKKFGYWRDTHLRIVGNSVQDLKAIFLMDWSVERGEKPDFDEIDFYSENTKSDIAVQIVMSGPDSVKEQIKRSMMRMITFAGEKIYLQTPYFVPDRAMLESLKMAAQSGVDVKIMIPCMPDHPFVYWANYSYCGELIKSGARVFRYENGFLHAKTLVVDGEVSTVGSANFDVRSFRLNFEANAFVYDKELANKMEKTFEDDMKLSTEVTLEDYESRGLWIKIKEAISVLLSDIL
ncbi:MAG: cardiolipin synthase [Christensenellales bacterium]